MDKICPLLTMMSMNKENEDHIIFDYEEPCMGEKCMWYWKCNPPLPGVTIISDPGYQATEVTPDEWRYFTAGNNAAEAS